MRKTAEIVKLAVLLAVSLIMYMAENAVLIFPALPFFRLGLGNIVLLFVLVCAGRKEMWLIALLRSVLAAVFSGNISQLMYSLPGCAVSCLFLSLIYPVLEKSVSLAGASALGAALHNSAQTVVFCIVTNSIYPLGYLPYLLLFGLIAGGFTGTACWFLIKYLPRNALWESNSEDVR